jgi:hypothetical protein
MLNKFVLITTLLAIFSLSIQQKTLVNGYKSNEENYRDSRETGKILKSNQVSSLSSSAESSPLSSASSDSLNKRFSNKRYNNREILLEDQDFDNSNNVKSADTSAKLYVNKKPTSIQKEINSEEIELEKLLDRNQRTDMFNKFHYNNLDQLKQIHRNKQLQKELIDQSDSMFNFDYDDMLSKILLSDIERNMKPDEIGYILTSMKAGKISHKHNYPNDADTQMEYLNHLDQNEQDLSNNDHKKPVKVNVNEKIYLENEYFNKLMSEAKQNPFFNSEALEKINLELISPNKQDPNSAFNSHHNPSFIKDQKSDFVNPNINDKIDQLRKQNDYLFIFVVAGCTLAGAIALMAAGICWYSVHRNSVRTSQIEYGSEAAAKVKLGSNSSGDRRLAQSAQMYHYQHQKQQMIAMEKANNDTKADNSDNSDGETEEGDYTVYECPGLAPTGEMEVKNPLFKEDFSASTNNIAGHGGPPPYSAAVSNSPQLSTKSENKPATESSESSEVQNKESSNKESTSVSITIPVIEETNTSQKH